MCAPLNQRSSPLLPTCQLHHLHVDAPEEGPEEAVRGGAGRRGEAVCMGAPRASPLAFAPCFLCQLPKLPLPLQLLVVSLLSSQPLRRGMGLREEGQGVHTGTLGARF